MLKRNFKLKKRLPLGKLKVLFILLLAAVALFLWWRSDYSEPNSSRSTASNTAAGSNNTAAQSAAGFDKSQHSVNDPASLWVVVNKGRKLPATYVPAMLVTPSVKLRYSSGFSDMMLRQDAATALQAMFNEAKGAGSDLMLVSGYRSYYTQNSVYNRHVNQLGVSGANKVSAKPGHSEHQTGLAADVGAASRKCELNVCFGELAEGKWLAANAHKYGFIIRYQSGKTNLTGYSYEPWHLRYVGVDLATELHQTDQTLEQFFELPVAADYPISIYQLGS